MIGDALIGGALGGGLRLAPLALQFWDRARERAHELRMQYVALEFEKLRQETKREEIASPEYHAAMVSNAASLVDSIREQFKATDSESLNAVSILVRPATTYALVLMYLLVKMFVCAMASGTALTLGETVRLVYTPDDYALLSGILAFWFCDRTLKK